LTGELTHFKAKKLKVEAVRERVRSEVKLNLALLEKHWHHSKKASDAAAQLKEKQNLAHSLHISALEKAKDGDVPLSAVFHDDLIKPDLRTPVGQPRVKTYKTWIAGDKHVADLLERAWSRIKQLKVSAESGRPTGDLRYLEFMLKVVLKSLARTK
jgi:hypothetical protein